MRTFKGIGDKPNVNKVDKKAFILAEKAILNQGKVILTTSYP